MMMRGQTAAWIPKKCGLRIIDQLIPISNEFNLHSPAELTIIITKMQKIPACDQSAQRQRTLKWTAASDSEGNSIPSY